LHQKQIPLFFIISTPIAEASSLALTTAPLIGFGGEQAWTTIKSKIPLTNLILLTYYFN